ncbi:MAG: HNH endonuclease [Gemmatimonadaceae bacterium]|nr:HNH endonuclease [Gemmatimonadaceae bacterium]
MGETVWMKWSAGPVVARAVIQGIRQLPDCSPELLRTAVMGFGLAGRERYWSELPPRFHALAIYLRDEEWLQEPLVVTGRSHRASWIVFPDRKARERWMIAPKVLKHAESRDSRGARTASTSQRFLVFRRDGYTCQYCGRRAPDVELHADHVVAWSRGGKTVLENLRTACSSCNLGKGAHAP